MAKKVDINSVVFPEHTISISNEYQQNYADNKVQTDETTSKLNTVEHYVEDVKIKQEISIVNIKMELSSETCNSTIDDIKIENGIFSPDYIKIEYDKPSCDHCHENYHDYCSKCRVLIHILDRTVISDKDNRLLEEIPKNLEIRECLTHTGIYTLKVIPEGVNFGPFIGITTSECNWYIKKGRIIIDNDDTKFTYWAQYINPVKGISEQNLSMFQHDGNLYYRTICEIRAGEELLVYFGEGHEHGLNQDVGTNFNPVTERYVENVFACTFCCLGFSLKLYLVKHKAICPESIKGNSSIKEIVQCVYCKIYMERQEYLEYHMKYCREKYTRHWLLSTRNDRKTQMKELLTASIKHKRQQCETYKCSQCQYKTTYKADLKSHANTHYEVKAYSCEICSKRFKQRKYLNCHMQNVHGGKDRMKLFKCSKCDYATHRKDILSRHSYEHETAKRFNCSICEFQTNYKVNLKQHVNAKHSDVKAMKQFKCPQCEYEANYRSHMSEHINAKHSATKKYKCEKCGFETPYRSCLKTHIDSHYEIKRFKCSQCEFRTNYGRSLTIHAERKHPEESTRERLELRRKVKRLNCSECEFKTNYERSLKAHTNAKHREIKRLKCAKCDYATNYTSSFNIHVRAKHSEGGGKRFQCSGCKFATNYKPSLRRHVETKKCETKKSGAENINPKDHLDNSCEEVFGI